MFEIGVFAVRYTLDRLGPLLPPPPARLLEAGCGTGALAEALGALGYQVTGVDPDAEACAAAAARGVAVRNVGIGEVALGGDDYDAVLFTRSLHHVDDLEGTVAHAVELVGPGGLVVLEEFARERVDRAAAGFVYDTLGLLVTSGAFGLHEHLPPVDPDEDPVGRWERERGEASERPLHTGGAMLSALAAAGATVESAVDTEALWRLVFPPAADWFADDRTVGALVESVRRTERRRIDEGTLAPVGMVVAARVGQAVSGGEAQP